MCLISPYIQTYEVQVFYKMCDCFCKGQPEDQVVVEESQEQHIIIRVVVEGERFHLGGFCNLFIL